ncbi:MAG: acetoacetate--CoA ligase, partial [Gammaproteobacteria bacterium]|nr:acetoacetate--CoA ligase [Gammaproteobacteria bacterium]
MKEARLWSPSEEARERTQMTAFRRVAESVAGRAFPDYASLHRWSVTDRAAFWSLMWSFGGVIGERGDRVLEDGDRMPGARWFPDARLNFAENLLGHPGT